VLGVGSFSCHQQMCVWKHQTVDSDVFGDWSFSETKCIRIDSNCNQWKIRYAKSPETQKCEFDGTRKNVIDNFISSKIPNRCWIWTFFELTQRNDYQEKPLFHDNFGPIYFLKTPIQNKMKLGNNDQILFRNKINNVRPTKTWSFELNYSSPVIFRSRKPNKRDSLFEFDTPTDDKNKICCITCILDVNTYFQYTNS
jgi:hypothetical protein